MNRTENSPVDHVPYRELQFCGNHFVNTPVAVEVAGHAPVLVAREWTACLWLSAPVSGDPKQWLSVVVDNESQLSDVHVSKTS